MQKNSVKTGLRFLLRHKLPAVIGISGLAVGLAGCILVFAYVRFERSFDRFHADADNLYRIVMHQPGNSANGTEWWYVSPHIMAPTLAKDFPEVVAVSQLMQEGAVVRWNGRTEVEHKFFYADASFFEIFNFPLLRGDPRTALAEPFSLLLT
jgi:putative ABC transport system permease protein